MNFRERSNQKEILDDRDISAKELAINLRELEKVNRLLGGYTSLRDGIKELAAYFPHNGKLHIVDFGCGGGDSLRYLAQQLRHAQFTGIDFNPAAVEYARQSSGSFPSLQFTTADVLSMNISTLNPDIALFNLFLHHFKEKEIVQILKKTYSTGTAIFISDLQRGAIPYQLFRIFSRIFLFSRIGRHDGKISIRKGFSRDDWHQILENSGIVKYKLRWRWAFRHQIIIQPRSTV